MKDLDKIIQQRKGLCFLDLEGTQYSHEMIAIGAIYVDLKKDGTVKKIGKPFYTLVKAKEKVGKVVVDLTGITDEKIKKNGISFRKAIEGLQKYLGKKFSKVLFVTYGSHDMRIVEQSCAHNLDANYDACKQIIRNNFDFAEFFAKYCRDEHHNTYSLTNALKLFEVKFEGTAHNALDDTRNLIYLYDAFIKRGDIVFAQYKQNLSFTKHLPDPLQKVVKELSNGGTVDQAKYDSFIKESLK